MNEWTELGVTLRPFGAFLPSPGQGMPSCFGDRANINVIDSESISSFSV